MRAPRIRRPAGFAAWIAFWLLLAPAAASASTPEYAVKAAYLFKFAAYVEWPEATFANPESQLVIGAIGADVLADELESIAAGQRVNGRPVLVRKLKPGDSMEGIHILFVGDMNNVSLLEAIAEARKRSILIVTESERAYALGSMINFVTTEGKVRFEVSLVPVDKVGLKISARMLSAAYRVMRGSP